MENHNVYIFPDQPIYPYWQQCQVFFDFSLPVKAAPHEYVIRTGQP